jgi:transposase-like protein
MSAKKKSANPLTDEQKNQLCDFVIEDKLTDVEIAQKLGVSVFTVIKWRTKLGLKKNAKKENIKKPEVVGLLTKESINKSNLDDEQKIDAWKKYFKTTQRYKRLAKELTQEDLAVFVDYWGSFSLQFDDMKASEEQQLEVLISYIIRLSHNRRSYKDAQINERELRSSLGGANVQDLDLEDEKHRFVWEAIISNNQAIERLNKEFVDLTSQYESLLENLNATRRQRDEAGNISSETFVNLVKTLNDREKRLKAGKYTELMKHSTTKKIEQFKKPYAFSQGAEPIILDGSDYIKKDKE